MLANKILSKPVVPLIQADDPKMAVATANALHLGGLNVIEIVLRSDAAMACLGAVVAEAPECIIGAGTVLTVKQAEEALNHGAKFIVSPGLNVDVVGYCQNHDLAVFPGVVTPSEVQLAWNMGLRIVKFFPAGLSGGVAMLSALSAVFREMQFMPTGGISAKNLSAYLAVPSVIACGGSWLTPQKEIDAGNFDAITALAREALLIAAGNSPK